MDTEENKSHLSIVCIGYLSRCIVFCDWRCKVGKKQVFSSGKARIVGGDKLNAWFVVDRLKSAFMIPSKLATYEVNINRNVVGKISVVGSSDIHR
jgi:hypothetical protein